MRKRYLPQQRLGTTPIAEVSISQKSRHELPKILLGLQHIFLEDSLREPILSLIESVVLKDKAATGRPGLDLWEILVLGVVRLGLDADYDRLEDLANNHKSLRGILGVDATDGFDQAKVYGLQRLKDNVSLVDESVLEEINTLLVSAGQKLVKKKKRTKTKGFGSKWIAM